MSEKLSKSYLLEKIWRSMLDGNPVMPENAGKESENYYLSKIIETLKQYSGMSFVPPTVVNTFNYTADDSLYGTNNTAPVAGVENAIQIGVDASAGDPGQIVIGDGAECGNSADDAIAIGKDANAGADDAVAIGHSANSSVKDGIAIGNSADSQYQYSLAIGSGAVSNANGAVSIGWYANASGSFSAIAIGDHATAGARAVAMGWNASSYDNKISIGAYAVSAAPGYGGIAIGYHAYTDAGGAIALGYSADAGAANATAIGHSVSNSIANSVRIGAAATSFLHFDDWTPAAGATTPAHYFVVEFNAGRYKVPLEAIP